MRCEVPPRMHCRRSPEPSSRRGRICRVGQRDEEAGPSPGLALDLDPAAVIGDDPPALRQPQPQAAAGLPGGIEGIERCAGAPRARCRARRRRRESPPPPACGSTSMRDAPLRADAPRSRFGTTPATATGHCVGSASTTRRPRRLHARSDMSCCGRRRRSSAISPIDQLDQGHRLQLGLGRPGEKPQVGDHLVDPHRLGVDQRQRRGGARDRSPRGGRVAPGRR